MKPDHRVQEYLALTSLVRKRRISTLTLRILAVNVLALATLMAGLLYLDQFRNSLIDARIRELSIQGEIIAGAIGEAATTNNDSAQINMSLARQILARLVVPAEIRGRLFGLDGTMLADSRNLAVSSTIRMSKLPSDNFLGDLMASLQNGMNKLLDGVRHRRDLPAYQEKLNQSAADYKEVQSALNGDGGSRLRMAEDQKKLVITMAVPVQRFRRVLGALLLSTDTTDIDQLVQRERLLIVKIFGVTLIITLLLSFFLAGTIARPIRRLAGAADKVRHGEGRDTHIPDFSDRHDEIGDLSVSLAEMTKALYLQIDAVAAFAADVSHEMKNPLSSLRSAVESAARTKDPAIQAKLMSIIQDDVKRLDRLISDISDASRLDAELSRTKMEPVDLTALLTTLTEVYETTAKPGAPRIRLNLPMTGQEDTPEKFRPKTVMVRAQPGPLGQVIRNLLDNAASFSAPEDELVITLTEEKNDVRITVEDQGPGIPEDKLEDIFLRFYSERPAGEAFGKHSGLGLNICRQIIKAHEGRIYAENRYAEREYGNGDTAEPGETIVGARFVIILPL